VNMKIEKNTVVGLSYTLTYDDAEGELIEKVVREEPLITLIGYENLLETFEQNILGKQAGDKFEFTIDEENAYGEYDEENVVDVPKNVFEQEGKFDSEIVYVGNIIPINDPDGNEYFAEVVEINNEIVKLDFNHPLAGETLHFVGEIVSVRQGTPEEIEMGDAFGNDEE
jgi:FKBP-type peptidyl-prolyl cis-trans isomerase SlyD